MSLTPGTKLGPYEILAPLGAGGMGEVYRAKDTKLGREVAIKVLPDAVSQDPNRLARFEREAKLLASLNHPNISTLHDFEQEGDIRFLVMELVEGEDLKARLQRGRVPIEEAITLFIQVAEGLGAAHGKGILHRDLKPANLKITDDGRIKILDFGLAKAMEEEVSEGDVAESPTLEVGSTRAGVVMGTGPYMSPEQAMGKRLDKRADIWAFGCCFYEALTGKRAFDGATIPETTVAIMDREPDWEALPTGTPEGVRRVLQRCLQKSPRDRLRDVGDALLEFREEAHGSRAQPQSAGMIREVSRSSRTTWFAATGVVLVAIAAVATWGLLRSERGALVPDGSSVVVLMDTPAPRGVYDPATRSASGTNADDLSDILRDLPVVLHKEAVSSTWDREDQILKQHPDAILIHRSAFFHSMNLEFGFGYPPFDDSENVPDPSRGGVSLEERRSRLYELADGKLAAFLGYIGLGSPQTRFLIYSRGSGGGWTEEAYRRDWVADLERRFPSLTGRVFTMAVPGGTEKATFRDPETSDLVRHRVQSMLGLESVPP